MATKVTAQTEKVHVSHLISDFLLKNRKVILITCSVILIALTTLLVTIVVIDKKSSSAIEKVEKLQEEWQDASSAEDAQALATFETSALETLALIGKSNTRNIGGSRAFLLAAEIAYSRKEWQIAREYYLSAAKAAPKAYTAGIALFNAAVSAEESGDEDGALALFTQAANTKGFGLVPRALFNAARIEEQRSQKDAALALYTRLVSEFADDSWGKLAKSRILSLESN
ncbi:MAG: tetratricopeptide repeat protein [Spirochaetales bacterium]|nr:tetratricopeptide repeat protein [Spirochaetales bacterium]